MSEASAPGLRPLDPATGRPMEPRRRPGYYPGFETLSQRNYWDAKTREVVMKRVEEVPPIRFFTANEARSMEAICDRVLPQDDREASRRIPIVPRIDERLFENRTDGYRFATMPPDRDAYRMGIEAIEAIAKLLHNDSFARLGPLEQDRILQSLHDGKPAAGKEIWHKMPVHRFWMLLVQDCCEAYYAHPWAWDEIGFGGPAYPRGYMRLERGEPEPWEVEEQRYNWDPPRDSASDIFDPIIGGEGHQASGGQGGTH